MPPQNIRELSLDRLRLPKIYPKLSFINPRLFENTKPYDITGSLAPNQEHLRTNLKAAPQEMGISDIRGFENCLDINETGFEFAFCPTDCTFSEDGIEAYLQETSEWVKKRLNATYSVCFAYKYRNSGHEKYEAGTITGSQSVPEVPAPLLHIDHTASSGPDRIRRHLSSDDQKHFLKKDQRIRTVTAWRPINGTVENFPLVLCNAYSINPDTDLVAGDRVTPQGAGEVYYIVYNENQQWYWLSRQTTEELTVFVNYDSQRSIGPAFVPHGTFEMPGIHKSSSPRESLEVRVIVIG